MNIYPILFHNISEAKHSCIAIMGGGGKTTLLHLLGNELASNYNVLLTSLTKSAFYPELKIIFADSIKSRDISVHFKQHNPLYIMQRKISPEKLEGISEERLNEFCKQTDICLFECDGARKLPLKVHNDRDPSVPLFATHVIILVGADAVNTSVKQGKVHRPDLFKSVWSISNDFLMDHEFISTVVTSTKGYLSKIPPQIKRIYFINKADANPENAQTLADSIFIKSGCPTFYGSLHNNYWKEIR